MDASCRVLPNSKDTVYHEGFMAVGEEKGVSAAILFPHFLVEDTD